MDVTDFFLAGDYLFDKGSIDVYYNSRIGLTGNLDTMYTFSYVSTQPCLIEEDAFLKIDKNTRLSIGRPYSSITDPELQPLLFGDATALLTIDGGTLHVTSSGMILTKGTLAAFGKSKLEIENTKQEYGLILGDGANLANGFAIEIRP